MHGAEDAGGARAPGEAADGMVTTCWANGLHGVMHNSSKTTQAARKFQAGRTESGSRGERPGSGRVLPEPLMVSGPRRMTMAMALACCGLVAGLSVAMEGVAAAPSWPQWRGPLGTGEAPEANPPTRWSETNHVQWKVKLPGNGASTPIIWGDLVFVQTAIMVGNAGPAGPGAAPKASAGRDGAAIRPGAGLIQVAREVATGAAGAPQGVVMAQAEPATTPGAAGTNPGRRRPGGGGGGGGGMRSETPTEKHQFVLMALDRATGRTVWQKVVREEVPHEGHHRDHGYSSSSPVTDGRRVFGWFGSRGLHCLDLQGNLKWQKDLGRMRTRNAFGEGSSPALHGGTVVVNWDHEGEDFIVAFDVESGKELWRNRRDELTTWTTPLVVEHGGKAQVVVPATTRIRSYDLATGAQLWECGGMTANVIPTPVAGFGRVYCTSGFRGAALLAINLGSNGDLTGTDAIAWQHGKSTPYVPSPLLAGGRIYFGSGNNAMLSCLDARTGRVFFEAERLESISGLYASPVAAGGRVYVAGRNGVTAVLRQSDAMEVLATNTLDDKFDASPAVVGRQLFLRGHQHLYCLAE